MRRNDLATMIASRLGPEHVVICGLGSTMYAWQDSGATTPTFYSADPMGLAPGLALGFAVTRPEREVVLLEGDGDLIMNLGVLLAIVDAAPPNLRIVVFNNGRYETGGRQPIPAVGRAQLHAIAEAAGFSWVAHCDIAASPDSVADAVDALFTARAPGILVVENEPEAAPYRGSGDESGVEARVAFQRSLEASRVELERSPAR